MDILRFITAGSVDDGKSTLIGRLLYDTKSLMIDQLEAIGKQAKNRAYGTLDLALITDGLRAEREQGITIDVAYKYFTTAKRKFIIADAPGHLQYTRNMVTGASNSDLAIILIDARNGVVEQTMRHSIIVSLLGIHDIIVAVNKMDLVDYSEETFNNIVIRYAAATKELGLSNVAYIPISAMIGDNIVEPSPRTPWYDGRAMLDILEQVQIRTDLNTTDCRFSVQYVIRPQTDDLHDYRGYAGKVISGKYRKGDKVAILPSGLESIITAVEVGGSHVEEVSAPQSATLQLADDIDISRGDMIVSTTNQPVVTKIIEALVCWMDSKPLLPGNKYLFQINSRLVRCVVKSIDYKVDVNTLRKKAHPEKAAINDLIKITLKLAWATPVDTYKKLKANGGAILIDETSHLTVGACMIQ